MYGKSIPIHRTSYDWKEAEVVVLWMEQEEDIYGSVYRNFISPFMLASINLLRSERKVEDPYPMYPLNLWLC